MPFFNGAIVVKKLWNMINVFFRKPCKWNRGFVYLDICIVPQILRQNISVMVARCFFLVQNNLSIERWENFVLLLLKSKSEWNLNDLPKDIFQLIRTRYQLPFLERIIIKPFFSGALKSYNFVWNIDTF